MMSLKGFLPMNSLNLSTASLLRNTAFWLLRSIGLMNKIKAYKLQEEGYDTVDANIHLGFDPDERDYGVGAQILRDLGIHKMRLITNNPVKRIGLAAYGLEITENVHIEIMPNHYNERYLKTKKDRMGHTLHFNK